MNRSGAPRRNPSWLPLVLVAMFRPALTFPIRKGSSSVDDELLMPALIPGGSAHTNAKVKDTKSMPAAAEFMLAVVPAVSEVEPWARLARTWTDCGDFIPSSITTGRKAKISDTCIVDTSVSGAKYNQEMKTIVGAVTCKGDTRKPQSCNSSLGLGMLTFDALTFPVSKSSSLANVDLSLSAPFPGGFAHTDTKIKATGTDGSSPFCMEIKSKPAADESMLPVHPAVSEVKPRAKLERTWTDSGDCSTHAKITGLTPCSIRTEQKARISGTGIVDTVAFGAPYDLEIKTMVDTLPGEGDERKSRSCSLPLGLGVLTLDAVSLPINKASTSVSVDLSLSALFPRRTEDKGTTSDGYTSSLLGHQE